MGAEEEKKPAAESEVEKKTEDEEKKPEEEKKTDEKPAGEEKKQEEAPPPPPPPTPTPTPPQEIVLKVFMHCEGCARKVRRCLKGFEGVEEVTTDCKSNKVVVKGEKADPIKVLERIQRKSHRQVELISPVPKPPEVEADEKPKPPAEEPKPEQPPPVVITVVLQVYMHCEACAMEIKKRIQRMKGVESAEPELKSSQVTVKGVFEAEQLVEYVRKRTGKQAVIVKQEPEKKEEKAGEDKEGKEDSSKEEEKKKGDESPSDDNAKKEEVDKGKPAEEGDKQKKEEGDAKETEAPAAAGEETTTKVVEVKRNECYYYPPRYAMELYAYPPQIFSDENPNACAVM